MKPELQGSSVSLMREAKRYQRVSPFVSMMPTSELNAHSSAPPVGLFQTKRPPCGAAL